ncbi:hypothetical protein B0H13DRAFT_2014885, partial [Mycena leptocephala]
MSFALPSTRAAPYVHAVVCLLPMLPLSFLADFLVPHIPAIHTLSPHRHLYPAVVRRSPLRLPVARRTSATLRWGSAHLESARRECENETQGAA